MSVVFTALIRPDLYAASGSLLALFDLKAIQLAVILYGLTHWKKLKKIHPAAWIGLSAVVGILFRFAGK